jgi:ferric-dicitrate binding protein FerR (iron transport regulator)
MQDNRFWILVSKKLGGTATAEELEHLYQLTAGDAEKKSVLEDLEEIWNSKPGPNILKQVQINEDAFHAHILRLNKSETVNTAGGINKEKEYQDKLFSKTKPFYTRWITYMAAAALLAGILFVYPLFTKKQKPVSSLKPLNEIIINQGSRSKIQLPDGSQVWVNSGSRLTYEGDFKGITRDVQLDGEAYFDVVKDAAHPFIVHTSAIDIKVLGTAFNIKAYTIEPTVEATLIHGSIEVINKFRPGTSKVMLKPHEKLVFNKVAVADTKNQDEDIKPVAAAYSIDIKPLKINIADSDIVETAWVYNKLSFEDRRLADLAMDMERWYNVKISIENDELKDSRISGSFVDETVEEALKELQFLVKFNYAIIKNEIKIMKK